MTPLVVSAGCVVVCPLGLTVVTVAETLAAAASAVAGLESASCCSEVIFVEITTTVSSVFGSVAGIMA
jgi:hypothetical protein